MRGSALWTLKRLLLLRRHRSVLTCRPGRASTLLLPLLLFILVSCLSQTARGLQDVSPRILVLSTLDGGVIGLDATTGSRVFTLPATPLQPAVSSWAAPGHPQYIPALDGALLSVHPVTGAVEQVDDVFLSPASDSGTGASEDDPVSLDTFKSDAGGARFLKPGGKTTSLRGKSAIVLKHQHTSVVYIDSRSGKVIRTIDFDSPSSGADGSRTSNSPGKYSDANASMPATITKDKPGGGTKSPSNKIGSIELDSNIILLSRTSVGVRVLDAASGAELANASVTHTTPSLLDGGVCSAAATLGFGNTKSRDQVRRGVRFAVGVNSMPLTSFIDTERGKVTMMLGKDQGILWSADIEANIIDAHGLGGVTVVRTANTQAIGLDKKQDSLSSESHRARNAQNTLSSSMSFVFRGRGETRYAMIGDGSAELSSGSQDLGMGLEDFSEDDADGIAITQDSQKDQPPAAGPDWKTRMANDDRSVAADERDGVNTVFFGVDRNHDGHNMLFRNGVSNPSHGLDHENLPMHNEAFLSQRSYPFMLDTLTDLYVIITVSVASGIALGVAGLAITRRIRMRQIRRRAVSRDRGSGTSSPRLTAGGQPSNTDGEFSNGSKESVGYGVPMRSESGWMTVGCLEVSSNVLGVGSHGTVVYEGRMMPGPRRVAVKRLLRQFYESARKEISFLVELDEASPCVVRYYAMEEDAEFIYLALELCAGALSDCVAAHEIPAPPLSYAGGPVPHTTRKALRQLMQGLADLHRRSVVHRDLKPQNVLLARNASGGTDIKIADVGLALRLAADRSSYTAVSNTHGGVGTTGWRAPEVLSGGRQTKAVDIFAAGCIVSYVVTGGDHPFGEAVFGRDGNIAAGTPDLQSLAKLQAPEAYDIVESLIANDPSARPSASEALRHPFFWTDAMKLSFLVDISDRLYDLRFDNARYTERLDQTDIARTHCSDWPARMDSELMHELGGTYISSASNLLRVVRNKRNHYSELSSRLQKLLGPLPQDDFKDESSDEYYQEHDGSREALESAELRGADRPLDKHNFLTYFLRRVPHLLMCVYSYAVDNPELIHQPHFTRYGFKASGEHAPLTIHPLVARLLDRSTNCGTVDGIKTRATASIYNGKNRCNALNKSGSERLRYNKEHLIRLNVYNGATAQDAVIDANNSDIFDPDAWRRLREIVVQDESAVSQDDQMLEELQDQHALVPEPLEATVTTPIVPPGFTNSACDLHQTPRSSLGSRENNRAVTPEMTTSASGSRPERISTGFARAGPRPKFGVDPHSVNNNVTSHAKESIGMSDHLEERRDRLRPWPMRKPALGFRASEREERDWSGLRRDRF